MSATCTTCNRRADDPFRVYNEDGSIRFGCVDEFHTGRLTPISASQRWHDRKAAKDIRRNWRKLRGLA